MLAIIEHILRLLITSGAVYFVIRAIFNNLRAAIASRNEEYVLADALQREVHAATNVIINVPGQLDDVIAQNTGLTSNWLYLPGLRPVHDAIFRAHAAVLLKLLIKYNADRVTHLYAYYADMQNYNEWLKLYRGAFIEPNFVRRAADPNIHLKEIFNSMAFVNGMSSQELQLAAEKIKTGPKWANFLRERKYAFRAVAILLGCFFIFLPDREAI